MRSFPSFHLFRYTVVAAISILIGVAESPIIAQTIDPSFAPSPNSSIRSVVIQPDGKLIVGGLFSFIHRAPRSAVARLNSDGTLDEKFTPPAIVGDVGVITRLSDGKILVGGNFTSVAGVSRGLLVRLQSDGTYDPTFTPNVTGVTVRTIFVQPDGKIVVGGNFSVVGGQFRSHLARLNSDGTLDAAYLVDVVGSVSQPADGVFKIVSQGDGTVYVAGSFSVIAGQVRHGLARFTPNWVLNPTYIPATEPANITAIALQGDGKLLVGGAFTRLGGAARENLARLLPDGLADLTFRPLINVNLRTFFEQADGKLIIGGSFTRVNNISRSFLARLNPDGTTDSSFSVEAGGTLSAATDGVVSVQLAQNGMLYLGGGYTSIGTLSLSGLTRLQLPYPQFSVSPTNVATALGKSATFTVTVIGDPTSFQWRKDGIPLAGATSPSLTISSVQAADAGDYDVIATNAITSAISAAAILTVTIPPGISSAPAALTVVAGAKSTLAVNAAGTAPFTYQWLRNGTAIPGATSAALTLDTTLVSDAAAYSVTVTNSAGTATSTAATLTVTPISRISNLSVLASLSTPSDSFTLGYVIGGSATSSPKPLLLRAAGPALGALGVVGTLDDPKLELFAGSTKTNENDNWGNLATSVPALTAAFTSVGAFPYTSPNSRDAAVTTSLATRDNSVRVSASSGSSGLVLAEVYDATPTDTFTTATPRLLNVSVLKSLGTGLTVGFTLAGSTPKTVLIRAIGPTLGAPPFGVPGTVADPQLTLFNSASAKLAENDNWSVPVGTAATALTAAFASVGAFPLPATSRDAALLITLPPGGYSVQVSGVNNTTGVALVEVYEVP